MKNRKSPGEDQIHAEFLKHAGKEGRNSIRMWFQKIWETGVVLSLWKKSNNSAYTESQQGPYEYHKLQTYPSD